MTWGYSPSVDKPPPTLTHTVIRHVQGTQWSCTRCGEYCDFLTRAAAGAKASARTFRETISDKDLRLKDRVQRDQHKNISNGPSLSIIENLALETGRNTKQQAFDLQMKLIHLQGQPFLGPHGHFLMSTDAPFEPWQLTISLQVADLLLISLAVWQVEICMYTYMHTYTFNII